MKKSFLIKIITALAAAALIICIIWLIGTKNCGGPGKDTDDPVIYPTLQSTQAPTQPDTPTAGSQSPETETAEPLAPYISPIDWASLAEKNPDIYAWLYIPDTEISYPVVQSPDKRDYYLDHSAYRREYSGGAIYSDRAYNTKTFDDTVTILYGHKMRSGAMLGTLQSTYSGSEGFNSHREVIIYLPDRELHYKVWVTTPFDRYHIMQTFNNFSDTRDFSLFVRTVIMKRAIEKQIDEEMTISEGDRLLILSTCLMGKVSQRYLLIGRLESVVK